MKNVKLPYPKALWSAARGVRYALAIALVLMTSSCEKSFIQESTTSAATSSARFSSEPLFTTSYEIEEYSATQILSKIPEGSKAKAFIEIAAQPRLVRQKVEFSLFADGSFEMETTPLEPTRTDLLPEPYRKKKYESVLASKTVVQNNVVHFYDQNGKETQSSKLKGTKFNKLAEKILSSSQLNKDELANEILGSPLVNEAYILGVARDKNAEIKTNGIVTEIRFDLESFAGESNESPENLSKYTVQHYDFKNKRMLGERLYDKQGDKLLYKSTVFYSPVDKGNQMEKVLSESFFEDPETGVKTKFIKQAFYTGMKVNLNI